MRPRVILTFILLLWGVSASAQVFNPVAFRPFESVFQNSGNPLPFFAQNPAVNYDNGGQGIAYNVPSPGCSGAGCGASLRPDAINFKTSTFGTGFPNQLSFDASPDSYNYTISVSSPGPYVVTLWVGSASTGGSRNVYIDNQLVGNVATPNTGSYATLAPAATAAFDTTFGTHILRLAWASGDATGSAGDLVAWQGSPVGNALVFNKGGDMLYGSSSPYTTGSYTLGPGSTLLIGGLEFANCTNPSIAYGTAAMTLPAGAITTVAQGGNNPLAMFYLINPPLTGTFTVTCPGANFLYLVVADYIDVQRFLPIFEGPAANSVNTTTAATYTSTYSNPSANNLILLMAGNIGGPSAITGGAGATLRQGNQFSSDGLFDSVANEPVGNYSMTTTVPNTVGGGPFSNSKQTHVFMAFNPGGPPPSPLIGTISLNPPSPVNFTVPAPGNKTLATIQASCPNGGCSTIQHTLSTSPNCPSPGTDNGLFALSGTSLNVGSNGISVAGTRSVCTMSNLSGATDSPKFTSFSLIGAAVIPDHFVFTPTAGAILDNTANGTQVGTFQVFMSDGSTNYPGTPTITACANYTLAACPVAIGTKTGTTWPLLTRVAPPLTDSTTDSITVSAP